MIKLIKMLLKNCNTGLKITLGSLVLSTALMGIYGASSYLPTETRKEIYDTTHLALESVFDKNEYAKDASNVIHSDADKIDQFRTK